MLAKVSIVPNCEYKFVVVALVAVALAMVTFCKLDVPVALRSSVEIPPKA